MTPKTTNKTWHYVFYDDVSDVISFLDRNNLTPADIAFGKAGAGTTYTLLYYAEKELR